MNIFNKLIGLTAKIKFQKSKIANRSKNYIIFDIDIYPSGKSYLYEKGHDERKELKWISCQSNEIIKALEKSYKLFRYDYLIALLSPYPIVLIMGYFMIEYSLDELYIIILLPLTFWIILVAIVHRLEINRRKVILNYNFCGNQNEYNKKIIEGVKELINCKRIWYVKNAYVIQNTYDYKINSGANYIYDRECIEISKGNLPWTKTNISIPRLTIENRKLYFMPNGLLIYSNKRLRYLNYTDLEIEASMISFNESENLQSDSEIINYTWQYVNVNGGPDRRYSNNYQIPVCLYGQLEIKYKNEQILYLITSKKDTL